MFRASLYPSSGEQRPCVTAYGVLRNCKLTVSLTQSMGRVTICLFEEFHSMKREDQQDASISCLLLTSVSTCFGHHYAHLQENKGPVTPLGVWFWF
jgi:hypothetical protein